MKQPMPITIEQSKLLASALRLKIINSISETPRTAKQVADLLGKTPGNIYYHMQRLYEGGLLELVETRIAGGVVEKYYRALATRFRPEQLIEDLYPLSEEKLDNRKRAATRLTLTEEDAIEMMEEFHQFLEKWEMRQAEGNEYVVNFILGRLKEKGESS